MKKIYLSLAGVILCGSLISQNAFNFQNQGREKGTLPTNVKVSGLNSTVSTRAGGPFDFWVDPIESVMTQKGLTIEGNPSDDQGLYLSTVYMDSTVRIGSGTVTNRFNYGIMLGSVLDLTSSNLDPSYQPIITKYDSYNVDSILILGSYVKKTPDIDTLYVWLVWGDSTNTSVFSKRLTNTVWVNPIATWRNSIIGPKVTGASAANGNLVKAAAPSTNKILVKYALQSSDSSSSGLSKQILIPLPNSAVIPAGNIVSCFYTFVPGTTNVLGDCIYSFSGATVAQNVNGFAGLIWGQVTPTVTQVSDYQDHQVDPTSWCMGATYSRPHRYSTNASYNNSLRGDLLTSPLIYYSVSGNSTVGISELQKNGFALSQNMPNPFSNQTTINYQIKKAATNVTLEVYDIRGVKMFNKTQMDVKQGNYSVEITNADYAPGIYFYSLIVDGNKVTKKMNVQ